MTSRRTPARSLTIFAAGFLLLDAILLVLAGIWSSRPGLIVWGVIFAAGSVGVVLLWRRYLVQLDELDEARSALRQEVQRLSRAVQDARS